MEARVGFVFEATTWSGSPTIQEPQLCSALEWFPIAELPGDTFIYTREVLRLYLSGIAFSAPGWEPAVV